MQIADSAFQYLIADPVESEYSDFLRPKAEFRENDFQKIPESHRH